MRQHIDPDLFNKLQKYGTGEWNECFHCGNCTALCPLTEDGNLFPRKQISLLQIGLKEEIVASTEPWLCYYCGDCSKSCPRDANPGELMMSLRRWLTSKYDWTGLAGLFYKSLPALIVGFILVAVAIIVAGVTQTSSTEELVHFGHQFELWSIISVFSLILLPNILRMFWFTIIKEKVKAPLSSYIGGFFTFLYHMFFQRNYLKCDDNTTRWFMHFLIVAGYLLLLFTTVFLNWFDKEATPFIVWLGYIVGSFVFFFTFIFIIARSQKKKENTKYSHPTDWLFIIWLFLMGLTAFIVRLLIDTDSIENNIWLYYIHLIVLAQWAILIVPFGKWAHFLYRPFAVYFSHLKNAAAKKQTKINLILTS